MRLGTSIDTDQPIDAVVASVRAAKDAGFSTVWSSQIFGADALTVFAVVAREVEGIEFGTGVIPVHPRHPQVLAQQALTVQAISGGRLTLGIGLSHQVVVEGMWGYSFEAPATYMREYLDALVPMLHGEVAGVHGERVHAVTIGPVGPRGATPPKLVVAALGPKMLELAATMTDGTVTWMTGLATLRDYIVPTITSAAAAAGRPSPSVIASLPVCCTSDVAAATERINETLAIYPTLPSYKAMLDKEGATAPADVALVGSKDQIVDSMGQLAAAGVTDMGASVIGSDAERAATIEVLAEVAQRS
jgi:5,10-methylenetetrahydromethanopterin reductase